MSPVHLKARKGEVASNAVLAGDPGRIRLLSRLLTNPRTVNTNRGFLVVTGERGGVEITLASHGIGGPSAAIVLEELIRLGASNIVRLGTAGGVTANPGEYLVARGAAYLPGGLYEQYLGRLSYPAAADPSLHLALIDEVKKRGLPAREGVVYSSDAFYAENRLDASSLAGLGVAGVEMECGAILVIASIRGARAGCVLMISNKLGGAFLPTRAIGDMALKAGDAVMAALSRLGR
ncbi:5'-methylthioadenosine phosphorylase [Thermocladium modestius]|uniref:5'-methylthioadenosine phosphorylase n=1 Tax=Thermocladium modestius TaxID=62609 RepID=A0A830GX10_9CREN|nr:nucleoside phosphorylase [Thermocladium modestius]GGP22147.1 5'-methylthioadenosine phosphorylase [Thermocladium modestius]